MPLLMGCIYPMEQLKLAEYRYMDNASGNEVIQHYYSLNPLVFPIELLCSTDWSIDLEHQRFLRQSDISVLLQLEHYIEYPVAPQDKLLLIEGGYGVGKTSLMALSIIQYLSRYPPNRKLILWISGINQSDTTTKGEPTYRICFLGVPPRELKDVTHKQLNYNLTNEINYHMDIITTLTLKVLLGAIYKESSSWPSNNYQ